MHTVNPRVTIKLIEQRSISKLANKGDKMENWKYTQSIKRQYRRKRETKKQTTFRTTEKIRKP